MNKSKTDEKTMKVLEDIHRYDKNKFKIKFNIKVEYIIAILYLGQLTDGVPTKNRESVLFNTILRYSDFYYGKNENITYNISPRDGYLYRINLYKMMEKKGLLEEATKDIYNLSPYGITILNRINISVNGTTLQRFEEFLKDYSQFRTVILSVFAIIISIISLIVSILYKN